MAKKSKKSKNNVAKVIEGRRSPPSTSRNGETISSDPVPDEPCSICLDTVNQPSVVPCCGRAFCQVCINEWIDNSAGTCPRCRTALKREKGLDEKNLLVLWFVQKVYRCPETAQEYFLMVSLIVSSLSLKVHLESWIILAFALSGYILYLDFLQFKSIFPNKHAFENVTIISSLVGVGLFLGPNFNHNPFVFLTIRLLFPIFWKKFSRSIVAFLRNEPPDDRITIIKRIIQNLKIEYSAFKTQYFTEPSISLATRYLDT